MNNNIDNHLFRLPFDVINIITDKLTPIDMLHLACTCRDMKTMLDDEVQEVGKCISTGAFLEPTYQYHHRTIVNLIDARKDIMKRCNSIKYDTKGCLSLKTSQFQSNTHVLPDIPHKYSVVLHIDVTCAACLTKALDHITTHISNHTFIEIEYKESQCLLQDEHMRFFKEYEGDLSIAHQIQITDVGIMHLKKIRNLDCGGCMRVEGGSLVKLMTHYNLCNLLCFKRGAMTQIPASHYEYLHHMTEQGYGWVW